VRHLCHLLLIVTTGNIIAVYKILNPYQETEVLQSFILLDLIDTSIESLQPSEEGFCDALSVLGTV